MIIRVATREDSDAIAALHAASWQSTYRNILSADYLDHDVVEDRQDLWAARFAKFDHRKHYVAIAVDPAATGGERRGIVGFVCVLLDEEPDHGALLDNLHIDPNLQGRGIGRRLMADAAHWVARHRPEWPLHLWIYEQNHRTIAFYRAAGGQEADHRVIVTPAGNRAGVFRFEWPSPARLAASLDASFSQASSS